MVYQKMLEIENFSPAILEQIKRDSIQDQLVSLYNINENEESISSKVDLAIEKIKLWIDDYKDRKYSSSNFLATKNDHLSTYVK
jgi:hypothetical protein